MSDGGYEEGSIARLSLCVYIRTMLNYFLAKDIAEFDQARESRQNPPSA